MLGDRVESAAAWCPLLEAGIHLNKDEREEPCADECTALWPELPSEQNQAEEDGLQCDERCEALQQPYLQQAPGL